MKEISISDLKDSLLQDVPIIEFSSECCCTFKWNFDDETNVLSCEISEKGCAQTKTLKSRGYKIMRNSLPTFGESRDGYFVMDIRREDIPYDLYQKVHMQDLDQVRTEYVIQHEVRFRESLLEWIRSSGCFVGISDGFPVILKSDQPEDIPDVKLARWVLAVLPMFQEGDSNNRIVFIDFSLIDKKPFIQH